MEHVHKSDSNFKTLEDGSGFLGATDSEDKVITVEGSSRDNEDNLKCGTVGEVRRRDIPVEASSTFRRSTRIIMLNKKKEMKQLEMRPEDGNKAEGKTPHHKSRSRLNDSSQIKTSSNRGKEKICPYCSKSHTRFSHLRRHIRLHTGEKPYECNTCSKAFTDLINLQRHIRIHTGEKPYSCPYCFRNSTSSTDMKIHIRRHTGEKPHKCTTCPKSFCKSSDLKRHTLSIHTKEKNN